MSIPDDDDSRVLDIIKRNYGCKDMTELMTFQGKLDAVTKQIQDHIATAKQDIAVKEHQKEVLASRVAQIPSEIERLQKELEGMKQTLQYTDSQLYKLKENLQTNENDLETKSYHLRKVSRIIQDSKRVQIDSEKETELRWNYRDYRDTCKQKGIAYISFTEYCKDIVYTVLGGYVCVGCQSTDKATLTLDHIHNDGSLDRKRIGGSNRLYLYYAIYKEEAKERLQVLCFNCNLKKERERVRNNNSFGMPKMLREYQQSNILNRDRKATTE